jgi:hypothetical protein
MIELTTPKSTHVYLFTLKYFLALLFFLSPISAEVQALTRYATISASGCGASSNTYAPASNTCGAGSARVHVGVGAIQAASDEQAAGDTILVRGLVATPYTGSSVDVPGGIVPKAGTLGGCGASGGVSLGISTCSVIQGYQNEIPTVRAFVGVHRVYLKNLIVDSAKVNGTIAIFGASFARLENLEVKNAAQEGIFGIGNSELINLNLHDNGFYPSAGIDNPVCAPLGGDCHGVYTGTGSLNGENIFDGGRYYNNSGYGIHCYTSCQGTIVRNLRIDHNGNFGLIVSCSSNCGANTPNLIHNVVMDNNGVGGMNFQQTGAAGYNLTLYNNAGVDVQVNANATIRNVLSSTAFQVQSGTVTQSNNITNATSAHFADAANDDFRLCTEKGVPHANCSGASSAVDSGVNLSAIFTTDITGSTRNAPWDIGAYESGSGGNPVEPDPELILQISCDNVVTDSSGKANHGTLTNGATYTSSGKYNQGCLFDGVNDYVSVADSSSLDLTHGFTVGAWVYPTSLSSFATVLSKGNNYFLHSAYGVCGDSSVLAGFYLAANDTFIQACHTTPLTLNTWTHLEVTYNRTSVILYIIGVPATTASGSAFPEINSNILSIGAFLGTETFFVGRIDEIRVYNYARNASQVITDRDTPINTLGVPASPFLSIGAAASAFKLGAGATAFKLQGAQ